MSAGGEPGPEACVVCGCERVHAPAVPEQRCWRCGPAPAMALGRAAPAWCAAGSFRPERVARICVRGGCVVFEVFSHGHGPRTLEFWGGQLDGEQVRVALGRFRKRWSPYFGSRARAWIPAAEAAVTRDGG